MKRLLFIAILAGCAGTANGATLEIDVELPRLAVAEYHEPYVALWIARPDHSVVANLGVWYRLSDGPEGEGETWLKDLRQWWRRTGRSLELPIDAITSASRGPGEHSIGFRTDEPPLSDLDGGEYVLHVEVAREVGGRELVRIPFQWPRERLELSISGSREVGKVVLRIIP